MWRGAAREAGGRREPEVVPSDASDEDEAGDGGGPRALGAAEEAVGGAKRLDQGSARVSSFQLPEPGGSARRVGSGLPGSQHQADRSPGERLMTTPQNPPEPPD